MKRDRGVNVFCLYLLGVGVFFGVFMRDVLLSVSCFGIVFIILVSFHCCMQFYSRVIRQ